MLLKRFSIFVVVLNLFFASHCLAAIPAAERDVLLALYAAANGDNWITNTNWNGAAGTECTWFGVSCDMAETTITGLDLSANNLVGTLPFSLTGLSGLVSNDFRFNAVYTSSTALISFLDASGPVGSLLDTQTLAPTAITYSNRRAGAFDVSWEPVNNSQTGGYRILLAELTSTTSYYSELNFAQVKDVADKSTSTTSITGLGDCKQYFVKVVSYTSAHADNSNEVVSEERAAIDPMNNSHLGTIASISLDCELIGGPFSDEFFIVYDENLTSNLDARIELNEYGQRFYIIYYNDDMLRLGAVDGGTGSGSLQLYTNSNLLQIRNMGEVQDNSENPSSVVYYTDTSIESSNNTGTAGGCSLRQGAPFDPVLPLMLFLAMLYPFRRLFARF